MERLGLRLEIFPGPPGRGHHPAGAGGAAPVTYLDGRRALGDHLRAFAAAPSRYLRTAWYVARHAEADQGYRVSSRAGCSTCCAAVRAAARRAGATRLHAHFAHDLALVALLVHRLTGLFLELHRPRQGPVAGAGARRRRPGRPRPRSPSPAAGPGRSICASWSSPSCMSGSTWCTTASM